MIIITTGIQMLCSHPLKQPHQGSRLSASSNHTKLILRQANESYSIIVIKHVKVIQKGCTTCTEKILSKRKFNDDIPNIKSIFGTK